jgi:hypothetical protein
VTYEASLKGMQKIRTIVQDENDMSLINGLMMALNCCLYSSENIEVNPNPVLILKLA